MLKQQCLMKLPFTHTGWLPKSPCFYNLSDVEVGLSGTEEGAPTYVKLPVFKKNSSYLHSNFLLV